MRLEVSKIFSNLWMTLDRHQIHFTQRIVSPLLQLMLVAFIYWDYSLCEDSPKRNQTDGREYVL